MIGDPDPYTATMNALQFFRVDDIVISTLPATRSGWLRADLIERVRSATNMPVEHVVAGRRAPAARRPGRLMEAAAHRPRHATHDDHHGPPAANRSSRVEPQLLGMLLFIISRDHGLRGLLHGLLLHPGRATATPWFPVRGHELPVAVAGVNTAILLSSSFTMHWALDGIKNGNRFGAEGRHADDVPAGPDVPLHPDQRVRPHRLRAPATSPRRSIFYGLTGLHGAHVFIGLTLLLMVTVRAFRGHFSPEQHRGVEVPGIYWHFVDVMWIVVYTTVYIL